MQNVGLIDIPNGKSYLAHTNMEAQSFVACLSIKVSRKRNTFFVIGECNQPLGNYFDAPCHGFN
jgi:hypothetical protein